MKRVAQWALACALTLSVASCGRAVAPPSDPQEPGPTLPDEAPRALLAVPELSVASGTAVFDVGAQDDVGVAKVELLLAGGSSPLASRVAPPFGSIEWDTTGTVDGIHGLVVRVTDTAGQTAESVPVRVVVLNHGQVAADLVGAVDSMVVPASLQGELDHKHHWVNPAGVRAITAVLRFTVPDGQAPWELGLSVGKGECPDNGEVIGEEVVSTASPIVVQVVPQGSQASTGLHFVHVRPVNASQHKGEALPHEVRVFLFQ